jgi:tight adherence protein B
MTNTTVILELAGLLQAGLASTQARSEVEGELSRLAPQQKSQFEAIWAIAQIGGGSVSQAMKNLGGALDAEAKHRREIELAFAAPKATAKLVTLLPLFGLALAQVFGLNPIGAVVTKPLALISVAFGAALLVAGHLWTRSILEKAKSSERDPGLFIDAIRFGVSSGLPFASAVDHAAAAFEVHLGSAIDESTASELERLSELNRERGASLVALLDSLAQIRRESQRHAEATLVAKLSVKLMVPLGLLTLPAFILISVVPIAIGLLSNGQNL